MKCFLCSLTLAFLLLGSAFSRADLLRVHDPVLSGTVTRVESPDGNTARLVKTPLTKRSLLDALGEAQIKTSAASYFYDNTTGELVLASNDEKETYGTVMAEVSNSSNTLMLHNQNFQKTVGYVEVNLVNTIYTGSATMSFVVKALPKVLIGTLKCKFAGSHHAGASPDVDALIEGSIQGYVERKAVVVQ